MTYQVANNRCWSCGVHCQSKQDLHGHLHQYVNTKDVKLLLDDDKYLNPFMQEDSLLYSFGGDEEDEDDYSTSFDKEEIVRDFGNVCIDDDTGEEIELSAETCNKDRIKLL